METKYKVGDKIRITKTSFEAKKRYQVGDIKTIIGENRQGFVVDSNWQHECPAYIGNHETVNPCYECEWELVEEKSRFHDAQPGDEVYCRLKGYGIIMSLVPFLRDKDDIKAVRIRWNDDSISKIELDGRHNIDHKEPTVFYRKGENNYLTERPIDKIDWSKVPINTQVFVSDSEIVNPQNAVSFFGYFPELERPFWIFLGMTEENAEGFKYCKLAEPCKPEWRK